MIEWSDQKVDEQEVAIFFIIYIFQRCIVQSKFIARLACWGGIPSSRASAVLSPRQGWSTLLLLLLLLHLLLFFVHLIYQISSL
jgi:hypothetical protein